MDAYDRGDTRYLLAKDRPDGQLFASVRLLTITADSILALVTDSKHLLSDLNRPGRSPNIHSHRISRPWLRVAARDARTPPIRPCTSRDLRRVKTACIHTHSTGMA